MAFDVSKLSRLMLGKQGENNATVIDVDVSDWLAKWPSASIQVLHQRHDEDTPYPVSVSLTGGFLTWVVTSSDTGVPGRGKAEIRAIEDEVLKKSRTIETYVDPALDGVTGEVPDALQDWAAQLEAAIGDAQSAQAAAEEALTSAEDALQHAEDAAADAAAALGEMEPWMNPSATASGLETGAAPTVAIQKTETGVAFSFGIPKGDQGEKGDKGDKGDTGSASDIKVNGIEAIDDNITLAAQDVGAVPMKIDGVTQPMLLITDAEGNVIVSRTFDGDITINGTLTATKVVGAVYA